MKTIINQAKTLIQNHKQEVAAIALASLVALGLVYGHKKNLIYASEGDRILRILEKHLL